jgi:hypothetical protein
MKIIEVIKAVATRSSFLRMGMLPSIDRAALATRFNAADIVVSSVGYDPIISTDLVAVNFLRLEKGTEEIVLLARLATELQVCIVLHHIIKNLLFFRWIDQIIWYSRRLFSLNSPSDRLLYKHVICDRIIDLYNNNLLLGRNCLSYFLGENPLSLKIAKNIQHKNVCLT